MQSESQTVWSQRTLMKCLLHVDKQGAVQRRPRCIVHHLEAISVENPICAGYVALFSPHFQPY